MTSKSKELVLAALRSYRGDDYERAEAAFRRFTPTEMQEPHGESGSTRQQILDGYRKHAKDVDFAIMEVVGLREN